MQLPLTCLLLLKFSDAWVIPNQNVKVTSILRAESSEFDTDVDKATGSELNPCWQDIYDEDCTMDSIFSATFVPSEWIKQLPCGSGMEDCDFPDDALLPGFKTEAHSEINVMEFLNIKRADNSKLKP